jgi:hypothetical protein
VITDILGFILMTAVVAIVAGGLGWVIDDLLTFVQETKKRLDALEEKPGERDEAAR